MHAAGSHARMYAEISPTFCTHCKTKTGGENGAFLSFPFSTLPGKYVKMKILTFRRSPHFQNFHNNLLFSHDREYTPYYKVEPIIPILVMMLDPPMYQH